MLKQKYLWLTDPHVLPWQRKQFIDRIIDEKPHGVFVTGDLSYGPTLADDLHYYGKRIGRPFYFIKGNHDEHLSSIGRTENIIRSSVQKHKNLIWLTESDPIALTDDVGLIGHEGWYDAAIGNSEYLKYTLDWCLIKDYQELATMAVRIEKFRDRAEISKNILVQKIEKALDQFKTIYLLTHFPPWPEATRDVATFLEKFWLPYNVNFRLGVALEEVMSRHKKRNLIVLAGHTHNAIQIHASRNIECRVGEPRENFEGDIIFI